MFARAGARHHQVAYVTNDLDRAVAVFEREYGAPGFFVFSNVGTDAAKPGGPQLRIALSHVGGVEIELIEPIGDTAPLFRDVLAEGPDLDIRFHHVAIRVQGTIQDWQTHVESIDLAKHPIVFDGAVGEDMRFCYTDERPRLGHYVEHIWMSPALLAQMRTAIPRFPVTDA